MKILTKNSDRGATINFYYNRSIFKTLSNIHPAVCYLQRWYFVKNERTGHLYLPTLFLHWNEVVFSTLSKWLLLFYQHCRLSPKLLLMSTQIQSCLNVESLLTVWRWFNIDITSTDVATLFQHSYFESYFLQFQAEGDDFYLNLYHWFLSTSLENIRKPLVFCFQGV